MASKGPMMPSHLGWSLPSQAKDLPGLSGRQWAPWVHFMPESPEASCGSVTAPIECWEVCTGGLGASFWVLSATGFQKGTGKAVRRTIDILLYPEQDRNGGDPHSPRSGV